jgi:SAM-dependent MidA family methyltransferase
MTPAEERVRAAIAARGPLTFAAFMELALYDPEVGYYSQQPTPMGASGDYFTSPELHPAFAVLLGSQFVQLWEHLGRPGQFVVHEAGPGSGLFARDLLSWARGCHPDFYAALEWRLEERSSHLAERQHQLLGEAAHLEHIRWVSVLEERAVQVVFANEFLDALPVHVLRGESDAVNELYVGLVEDRLALVPGPVSDPRLTVRPPPGYLAEVSLAVEPWVRAAARAIGQGLLIVVDYGYTAIQRFRPGREHGTLLCYYQHTLSSDPLARIGLQDITAEVYFDEVIGWGRAEGLATLGLTSQRDALSRLGFGSLRSRVEQLPLGQTEAETNLRALDALVDPAGLGRLLVLTQGRGVEQFEPYLLTSGSRTWPADNPPLQGPEHLRLPGPAELEGLTGFEEQWAELIGESEADQE